ncbi:MAG: hypothetical protein ACK40X_03320 [Armatimonadota bacterium]
MNKVRQSHLTMRTIFSRSDRQIAYAESSGKTFTRTLSPLRS